MFDSRFNRIATLFSTCLGLIFISTLCHCSIGRVILYKNGALEGIRGEVGLHEIEKMDYHKPLKADYVVADYSLNYDHSSLWNWSTHEHFAFIRINYKTDSESFNSVVVWDKIALTPEQAVLNEVVYNKYPVVHLNRGIRGVNLFAELCFQYMPWAGFYETNCHPVSLVPTKTWSQYGDVSDQSV
eukprot:GHVH01010609.1.p1 GENE.GHVH01010609.1~~GHVH01010609.1.p1  ORF type:complete len:185 (+),score=18.06 GHVH01010609.1:83-637(+)